MPPAFAPFTPMHGWSVLAGLLVVALAVWAGKRGGRTERITRMILAFLCFSAFGYTQAAWTTMGTHPDLDSMLPLHLCDLAAIIAGFALLTERHVACLLTYFWGLAATVQALLTPAITVGFPHPAYLAFFIHHFAIVAAAFYLPIVRGWRSGRPWWKGPLQALMWANVYLLLSMAVNAWLGTNFGFTARKPVNPSLLDHMGDWPFYLIGMELLAVALFSLLALPVAGPKKGGGN